MKDNLCSLFQGVGYEKGFGPSEVPSFEHRKKRIFTYSIVSAKGFAERREIFGEDEVMCSFDMCDCFLQMTWINCSCFTNSPTLKASRCACLIIFLVFIFYLIYENNFSF